MEDKLFKKLIGCSEGIGIDFKSRFYNISDKKSRTSFVKDVIAMANSSMKFDCYIICGIDEKVDKTKEFLGIDKEIYIDAAQWREVLSKYTSHPILFEIIRHTYEGKLYIIIKVLIDQVRPIICTVTEETKLIQGNIYFRNGSINDVATDLVTVEKIIQTNLLAGGNVVDPTYNRFIKFPAQPYYTFVGRKDEIEKIDKELIKHPKNYMCALHGEGGVGKTSIAYKVASKVKEDIEKNVSGFDEVIWISAKDQRIYYDIRSSIQREFTNIQDIYNKILNVFYEPMYIMSLKEGEKLSKVVEAMEASKLLFVLDNLESFNQTEIDELVSFMKDSPLGHKFLLTSRHDIRVNECISIKGFDEKSCKEYVADILEQYKFSESELKSINDNIMDMYKLTCGNPLYLKFFMAQIKKGRSVQDILKRNNAESERGLKEYCFDSTLLSLKEIELSIMYALALSDKDGLNCYEINYIIDSKLIDTNNILDRLSEVSMVAYVYKNGEKCYFINEFLKAYLIEENRIPKGVIGKYLVRIRRYKSNLKDFSSKFTCNFGIENSIIDRKKVSYNITEDILYNCMKYEAGEITELLKESELLYNGNYLTYFIKYYYYYIIANKNISNIVTNINTDFMFLLKNIDSPKEKVYCTIWMSILFILIKDYEGANTSLQSIIDEGIELDEYTQDLNRVLNACTLTCRAFDFYKRQQFTEHDKLRLDANKAFDESIGRIMENEVICFIKSGVKYCYRLNSRLLSKDSDEFDIDIKNNYTIFAGKKMFNQ